MITTNKNFNDIDNFLMITKWLYPGSYSDTQYGIVTNEEWCKREQRRIGDDCDVIFNGKKLRICLKWKTHMLKKLRAKHVDEKKR